MSHQIREKTKNRIFFLWEKKDYPIKEIIKELGWSSNSINILTRILREEYKTLPYFKGSDRDRVRKLKKSNLEGL